jgi:hypothetical protein
MNRITVTWFLVGALLFHLTAPALAAGVADEPVFPTSGLSPSPTGSLFTSGRTSMMDPDGWAAPWTRSRFRSPSEFDLPQYEDWPLKTDSPAHWTQDGRFDSFEVAALTDTASFSATFDYQYWQKPPESPPETVNSGKIFMKGWILITGVEMALLAVTASLPKSWTGWSGQFVKDGMANFRDAYNQPPVWDTDHWGYNYIGHPYGGSVYYNTVRCQGANPSTSFLFSMALSVQWEYIIESVAERPSTQDLIITPVIGSIMGEGVHRLTTHLKKDGTNFLEKVIITILNPTSVVFNGYS